MKYIARFGPITDTKYPKVTVPEIHPKQTIEPSQEASSIVIGPEINGVLSGDIKTEIAGEIQPTIVPYAKKIIHAVKDTKK